MQRARRARDAAAPAARRGCLGGRQRARREPYTVREYVAWLEVEGLADGDAIALPPAAELLERPSPSGAGRAAVVVVT